MVDVDYTLVQLFMREIGLVPFPCFFATDAYFISVLVRLMCN